MGFSNRIRIDGSEQRGQSWYGRTDTTGDLLVQIGDGGFHLHKYPFLSQSEKMIRVIYDSHDVERNKIGLDDHLGGAAYFELAAKFFYGIAIDLTYFNVNNGGRASDDSHSMSDECLENQITTLERKKEKKNRE